jgi:hypothetical protein
MRSLLYSLRVDPQKTPLPLLLHVDSLLQRRVMQWCAADHRKHHSSIIACICFHGNVFTEPLPSSELFWLSDIMSHYCPDSLNLMFNSYCLVLTTSVKYFLHLRFFLSFVNTCFPLHDPPKETWSRGSLYCISHFCLHHCVSKNLCLVNVKGKWLTGHSKAWQTWDAPNSSIIILLLHLMLASFCFIFVSYLSHISLTCPFTVAICTDCVCSPVD